MTIAKVINLSQVANNLLSPTYLKDDLSKTVAALVQMQIYATLALQQPMLNFDIGEIQDILANLNSHQTKSKRHADYFLTTLAPSIISALTDITGYTGMFQSFEPIILELLPKITESSEARQQVISLLNQLENEAQKRENAVNNLVGKLRDFTHQIQDDKDNFKTDDEEANQKIGTDKGELAKLQQDIKDTEQKIRGEIAGVVMSALAVVGGAILIGVGTLATLPANVTAASVIIPGVGLVVTGSVALTTVAANLANDNKRLSDLYEKTAKLNTTITLIRSVAMPIESLFEIAKHMVDANNALSTEWSSILAGIRDFQEYIARASNASDIAYIEASLRLADSNWNALAKEAKRMMVWLVDIKQEEVDNVLEFAKKAA